MYLQGRFFTEYNFLQGMGSANTDWVNGFQNPFNQGPLARAAALGPSDPVGAYNILAPAFAKIQQDAAAFVLSHGSAGQTTIDGWHKDFPLINGMLDAWRPAWNAAQLAAAQGATAPGATTPGAGATVAVISDTGQPLVYSQPAAGGSGGAPVMIPASSPTVNVTTGAGAAVASTLEEYAPWILGAVGLGLLLQQGGGKKKAPEQNRPRRRRRR